MPMPITPRSTFTLADLARLADVTPRTVRYYVAQGLLPSPGQAGPGAHYPEAALSRLRLIRELQRSHLPLGEIRTRLSGLTDAEIHELVAPAPAAPPDTAIDYIRGLLEAARLEAVRPAQALPITPPPAPAMAMAMAPRDLRAAAVGRFTRPSAPPPQAAPPETAASFDPAETVERSQWDRIALTPDIELHIRRPLGRLEQRRVERLITIARQVLKENAP